MVWSAVTKSWAWPSSLFFVILIAQAFAVKLNDDIAAPFHTLLRSSAYSHNKSRRPHNILVTATTANVWERTTTFLTSLASCSDKFDILIVDECSSDGTREKLSEMGVPTILVNESSGVTYNWNQAYNYFLEQDYQYLVYSNNDVLIPDGVITELIRAMNVHGCSLITPMSTIKGKGHKKFEGIEFVYHLGEMGAQFVNNPANYAKVQRILDEVFSKNKAPVVQTNRDGDPEAGWRKDFNGFFFVLSRNITSAEYKPGVLFDPANRIVGQETDLAQRIFSLGGKVCLHTGAFVYHYKSSTIPNPGTDGLDNRENFSIKMSS